MRTSAGGSASPTSASSAATVTGGVPPWNTAKMRSTSSRVVVSSSAMPIVAASIRRKLTPCATPSSMIRCVRSPVATAIVSKNAAVGTVKPSLPSPAFRIAVSRCARRAIRTSPSAPW